ncbi:MAG: glycosyltransferase family 2 protein [Muribaculaceae bacterium]|nr:glycosyltransferase family 2 protein [Muribaculaceae bacterium]
MKKIAAITMVRDDDFFLRKWVEYYGKELGRENLYILFDGEDQKVPDFCKGTHTYIHKRLNNRIVEGERMRLGLLSDKAAELLEKDGYDIIIGVDCDEFIIVDPKVGKGLAEYLSAQDIDFTISPLGVDIGQHLDKESEIDGNAKFLQQRRFAYLDTRYTKGSIIAKPIRWGRGFHRVKGHNFHICPDLYLFHFGCIDMKRMRERFMNPDRIGGSSTRHFKKRTKTISIVTNNEAKDFDRWTNIARKIQTWIRPPYSWNKPAMLGYKIVVEIPERFRNIL